MGVILNQSSAPSMGHFVNYLFPAVFLQANPRCLFNYSSQNVIFMVPPGLWVLFSSCCPSWAVELRRENITDGVWAAPSSFGYYSPTNAPEELI